MTAQSAFYPAAALYAVLALPASVLVMTGHAEVPAAFASPLAHAHEMLFGFALAVVAGNQLGAASGPRIGAQLALWVAARVAFLTAPQALPALLLNGAFAALLAAQVAPRLFGSAKKLRNFALPGVLVGLGAAAVAWEVASGLNGGVATRRQILATLLLFALLMLFMGGRIIAPAVAGQLYRQGERLDARVQPRLEASLIVACVIALAALFVTSAEPIAGAACASAGALAGVRLARWRLWAVRGRPDLLCLAAGYLWLALGLAALGACLAVGRYASAALHLMTIGALGTLTLNVMATSWLARAHRLGERCDTVLWATALIAAATGCRVVGAFHREPWLLLAAGFWSAGFALLLGLFWRVRRQGS